MSEHLTIGAFARRTGLSVKALRLYDRSGLLVPDEVDPGTGYRYYSPAQEARAQQISLLRRVEMPLAQIEVLLDLTKPGAAADALLSWWAEQEQMLTRRRGTVDYLVAQWRKTPAESFAVQTRQVPDRLIASITVNVRQAELIAALNDGATRLHAHLTEQQVSFGTEWWALYHGVVSPDSDGPLEICVPFTGRAAPAGPIAIRVEEAHTEAFTPITAAQCRYPRILHAYDAVVRTARQHGTIDRPVREIYPVPWPSTPHEYAADIAQPYREDQR